jgi:hypothetical protein
MSVDGSRLRTVRSASKAGARRPSCFAASKRSAGAVVNEARICGNVIANLLQDFAAVLWIEPADSLFEMRHVALDNGMVQHHATCPSQPPFGCDV